MQSSLAISLLSLGCFLTYGYGYGLDFCRVEDGVVYHYRSFPDAPYGYKEGKTETWQECQALCSEMETCKGFTWHKPNNYWSKACSLFSSYAGKSSGYSWSQTCVSGKKECWNAADAKKLTPVTAELSSTSYRHFAATECIDGELKARHKLCHSQKEDAPWLALDYGERTQVSVEKVLLYNRFDGSFERTKDVQIRICNELPKSGKTMATCGQALGTFKGPPTRGQIVEIHSGPGWAKKTGRYLIVQMKGTYINLHEVEAVGISYVATSKGSEG